MADVVGTASAVPQEQASRSSLGPPPLSWASGGRRRLMGVRSKPNQQASCGRPGRWLFAKCGGDVEHGQVIAIVANRSLGGCRFAREAPGILALPHKLAAVNASSMSPLRPARNGSGILISLTRQSGGQAVRRLRGTAPPISPPAGSRSPRRIGCSARRRRWPSALTQRGIPCQARASRASISELCAVTQIAEASAQRVGQRFGRGDLRGELQGDA